MDFHVLSQFRAEIPFSLHFGTLESNQCRRYEKFIFTLLI